MEFHNADIDFDLGGRSLSPNPLRTALAKQLSTLESKPTFLRDVRIESGMPLMTCVATGNPFLIRKEIDKWFLDLSVKMLTDNSTLDRPSIGLPMYRGIGIDRLQVVATHGIDVDPPNSVIWATTDLAKALEYGGDSSLAVLILHGKGLAPSYKELLPDAPETVIADVERDYGTNFECQLNGSRYYSRLPDDDPRRNTAYEHSYGFYIPGPPFSALAGIVIFTVSAVTLPGSDAPVGMRK